MGRLIDADELKAVYIPSEIEGFEKMMVPVEVVLQNIDDMPTVNAVPVVYGKWVVERICNFPVLYRYECSECGMENDGEDNFCPNCGARMDGRKDEFD